MMYFTPDNGLCAEQCTSLKRKVTEEACEQAELQPKKKLRRPKTEEKVADPLKGSELHPEEADRKRESEVKKTKMRDVYDHYTPGKLLGHGAYGYVFAAVRKSDGKKVALKIMEKREEDSYITIPGDTRSLPAEVALLELVSRPPHCPLLIQLLEWFESPNAIILVLERPDPCVDVFDFLSNNSLTEDEILTIMRQIVLAARQCRERGVFHRDIKAENVLVNPLTLQVKLIDFGLGDLHRDTKYTKRAGTEVYMPPETFVDPEYEAEPFTVWGLGVLLYILLCRKEPFDGEEEIVGGHLIVPDELSEESQDLIWWCLQRNPKRRPTLNQVLGHDWFLRQSL